VRELRHVVHLQTPIVGELKAPRHVLDLVEALHPTPAVGGVPRQLALDWISQHEPLERGWYAGPLGWFDAAGDGEFWVGLRSGVFHKNHASLYAGAGIVRGSETDSEYAETEVKLTGLIRALGIAD
jgi:isochorismate synthase EntC